MKPCVCNGNTENCKFCGGSGYVPDKIRLPHRPSDLENWVPESQTIRERPSENEPPVQTYSRSSSLSQEMKGCLWSLVLQAIFFVVVALLYFMLSWLVGR